MKRELCVGLFMLAVLAGAPPVWGQGGSNVTPTMFELMINGESFTVEANRMVELASQQQPGVSYKVALRVAPTQRLRLNSCQFEYDRLARVEDDRQREQRTVQLIHELGFSMLITDLGGPLEAANQEEALKLLSSSVAASFKEKATDLTIGEPHSRKFGAATGRGVLIRYRDAENLGHTCLVYVLVGPSFSASCIVQYLDDDAQEVLPLVKKTLDSFKAN